MANNAGDLCFSASPDLTVETLDQVGGAAKNLPSPTLVTDTVLPEDVAGKRREAEGRVTDEAANSVGVHAQKERNKQVVRVPERLERLLANSVVRSRVHEKHAKEHDVARNAAGLSIMDLEGEYWSNLGSLDVEEAAKGVSPGEWEHKGAMVTDLT